MVRETLPETHNVLPTSAKVTSLAGTQPDTSDVGVGVFSGGTGVGLEAAVAVAINVAVPEGVSETFNVGVFWLRVGVAVRTGVSPDG